MITGARRKFPPRVFINTKSAKKDSYQVGNGFELEGDTDSLVLKNAAPYSAGRIDRVLPLGGVEQWELRSYLGSNPFHIHVNPFQIVKIVDPNGNDVSQPGAVDNATLSDSTSTSIADPQYPGLQGVWKDMLWIKSLIAAPSLLTKPPVGGCKIIIRTRYERYIGQFVPHCHILDHEDQGMMQNITINVPDGQGGTTQGHH